MTWRCLVTPLRYTVVNNYIAGIRSGNKAGGIVFTANPFSQADGGVPNAGNQAVLMALVIYHLRHQQHCVLATTISYLVLKLAVKRR